MTEVSAGAKIGIIAVVIIGSVIIAVLAMSFDYLDYNQLGFKRQKSTSQVFTDKVYSGGRHFIGPDFTFKTYPSTANTITLSRTTVFSKDTLEVYLEVQFQYFLRPEQLSVLHRKYQLTYNSVIRGSAIDALKGTATKFFTQQFITNRSEIEEEMAKAVRLRIGGRCCEADCKQDTCLPSCIPLYKCTKEEDMGLMVNMRYFHLTSIAMPSKVYSRYLKALLLVEESQMEKYRLEEAVVRKEVDESVKIIGNEANEVSQNATAQARLIEQTANAEALKIVGTARSEGLETLMEKCKISDAGKKMSLHYLKTLGDDDKVNMAVDFKNYVIGGR